MKEVLALADDEGRDLWENQVLSYTQTRGHPELRQAIAECNYEVWQRMHWCDRLHTPCACVYDIAASVAQPNIDVKWKIRSDICRHVPSV